MPPTVRLQECVKGSLGAPHLPGEETRVPFVNGLPFPARPGRPVQTPGVSAGQPQKGAGGPTLETPWCWADWSFPGPMPQMQPSELPSGYCCKDTSSHPAQTYSGVGLTTVQPRTWFLMLVTHTHTFIQQETKKNSEHRTPVCFLLSPH